MKRFDEKKAQNFWLNKKYKNAKTDPTRHGDIQRLAFDTKFTLDYIKKYNVKNILDLGAGTGLLSKEIKAVNRHMNITLVEKNQSFISLPSLKNEFITVNEDAIKYCEDNKEHFDLILLFGVINSIEKLNSFKLYSLIASNMNSKSILIIKHQCGLFDEFVVDNFSEDLKTFYTARYPFHMEELEFLKTLFSVNVFDIYPEQLNKHKNTHFFAYVCEKK